MTNCLRTRPNKWRHRQVRLFLPPRILARIRGMRSLLLTMQEKSVGRLGDGVLQRDFARGGEAWWCCGRLMRLATRLVFLPSQSACRFERVVTPRTRPRIKRHQPRHLTTSQHHKFTISQPNSQTTKQPKKPNTSQPRNITLSAHQAASTSQPHNLATSQPHALTPSQPHNQTTPQHHNTTTPQHHNTTTP